MSASMKDQYTIPRGLHSTSHSLDTLKTKKHNICQRSDLYFPNVILKSISNFAHTKRKKKNKLPNRERPPPRNPGKAGGVPIRSHDIAISSIRIFRCRGPPRSDQTPNINAKLHSFQSTVLQAVQCTYNSIITAFCHTRHNGSRNFEEEVHHGHGKAVRTMQNRTEQSIQDSDLKS